jgi:hypothetical protein
MVGSCKDGYTPLRSRVNPGEMATRFDHRVFTHWKVGEFHLQLDSGLSGRVNCRWRSHKPRSSKTKEAAKRFRELAVGSFPY